MRYTTKIERWQRSIKMESARSVFYAAAYAGQLDVLERMWPHVTQPDINFLLAQLCGWYYDEKELDSLALLTIKNCEAGAVQSLDKLCRALTCAVRNARKDVVESLYNYSITRRAGRVNTGHHISDVVAGDNFEMYKWFSSRFGVDIRSDIVSHVHAPATHTLIDIYLWHGEYTRAEATHPSAINDLAWELILRGEPSYMENLITKHRLSIQEAIGSNWAHRLYEVPDWDFPRECNWAGIRFAIRVYGLQVVTEDGIIRLRNHPDVVRELLEANSKVATPRVVHAMLIRGNHPRLEVAATVYSFALERDAEYQESFDAKLVALGVSVAGVEAVVREARARSYSAIKPADCSTK